MEVLKFLKSIRTSNISRNWEDEVLSNGIGHLEGTSLPIGGENTHSVLTGHRGLPSSEITGSS